MGLHYSYLNTEAEGKEQRQIKALNNSNINSCRTGGEVRYKRHRNEVPDGATGDVTI
jgi:hypothetical protein